MKTRIALSVVMMLGLVACLPEEENVARTEQGLSCMVAVEAHCGCAHDLDAEQVAKCREGIYSLCAEHPSLPHWTEVCLDELFAEECAMEGPYPYECATGEHPPDDSNGIGTSPSEDLINGARVLR